MPSRKTRSTLGRRTGRASRRKVRYAVVGLGHIAQAAVLPAFAHARRNSELAALVSDDPVKLRSLARRYRVRATYGYVEFSECLSSGEVEAVYIALPNFLHRDYAVAAAEAGCHVLCEKPLAVTEEECEEMIRAAENRGVRLMTAYRLHFEKANLGAIDVIRSGRLGEPRIFQSVFGLQVAQGNVRLEGEDRGGGPLYDLGVYCVNAARNLFRDEPEEVVAFRSGEPDERFRRVEEMVGALLRFPGDRLAQFTCSFGSSGAGWYQVVGTKGNLRVDPAYDYAGELVHHETVGGKTRTRKFARQDQFAAELLDFSDCVLEGRNPEPSGREGLADVRIIRALLRSAGERRPIAMADFDRSSRPDRRQEMSKPPVPDEPKLVRVERPSRG